MLLYLTHITEIIDITNLVYMYNNWMFDVKNHIQNPLMVLALSPSSIFFVYIHHMQLHKTSSISTQWLEHLICCTELHIQSTDGSITLHILWSTVWNGTCCSDHYNETTVPCGMCCFYCHTGSLFCANSNNDNETLEEEIL